jgi:hypothetical protein
MTAASNAPDDYPPEPNPEPEATDLLTVTAELLTEASVELVGRQPATVELEDNVSYWFYTWLQRQQTGTQVNAAAWWQYVRTQCGLLSSAEDAYQPALEEFWIRWRVITE